MLDKESFKRLFTEHYQNLFQLSLNLLRDSDLAHDCVQDVYTKIWERKEQLMVKVPIEVYLKKAVINTSINYQKRLSRQIPIHQNFDLPEEEQRNIDHEQFRKLLESGINVLPKKCRVIFILSRIEGLDNQEISDYLDLSKKTIENQLSIALKNLKQFCEQEKNKYPQKYFNLFAFFIL